MIIPGRFIGDAPYFAVHLRWGLLEGLILFLADTGASRTTLLDRDIRLLGIPSAAMEPAQAAIVGIGGSVRSFVVRDVQLTFRADAGALVLRHDLWAVQHDLDRLPPEEVSRLLRLPSILGCDLMNRFRFVGDYQSGKVALEGS